MKKSKYVLNFLIIFLLTIGVLWFALKDNYREVLEAISSLWRLFYAGVSFIRSSGDLCILFWEENMFISIRWVKEFWSPLSVLFLRALPQAVPADSLPRLIS